MKRPVERRIGIVERYQEFLEVSEKTLDCIVSLNEGDTPLILSESLSDFIGVPMRIYYKFEGLNPTGSFKDRGMTFAVTKAREHGQRAVICASTGNTSASAAAYAARAKMKCFVLIPEGKIAKGKLSQAFRHGAKVIMIKGNFDQALEIVKKISDSYPI
jgi:threonine synthase